MLCRLIADVVWPALLLEGRILTWWAILTGLVVEYLCLLWITSLSPIRAITADLVMNAASTLIGIIAIPIAGLLWEIGPGLLVNLLFGTGTFNLVAWIATVGLAAGLNTYIERFVLRRYFKQTMGRNATWLLFGANAGSVSLAFGSLAINPPTA